ncbi:MAG: TauD/TfdA family dioxygenase [Acidobacteriota bacterium]
MNTGKPVLNKLGTTKRQSLNISQQTMVTSSFFTSDNTLPMVIQPAIYGIDLITWASTHKDFIETNLLKYGAILFRNFKVNDHTVFEHFINTISTGLLEYTERSSPRRQVSGNIYTSTDYPADQTIFLHNENSYQNSWPLKIFFYCEVAPLQGGETPIADIRKVYKRIDPKIKQQFIEKRWMLIRNLAADLGLSWQTVFQTYDKSVVEEHCRKNGIEFEWRDLDRLRIRALRPAIAKHPKTGETIWFNHATFFHPSTLDSAVHEVLVTDFKEEDLPTVTYYGDGSSIELSVLDHLRKAYQQETIIFPWQQGDILMLDNMLVAHGRRPYSGPRKILVGMAEATSERGV